MTPQLSIVYVDHDLPLHLLLSSSKQQFGRNRFAYNHCAEEFLMHNYGWFHVTTLRRWLGNIMSKGEHSWEKKQPSYILPFCFSTTFQKRKKRKEETKTSQSLKDGTSEPGVMQFLGPDAGQTAFSCTLVHHNLAGCILTWQAAFQIHSLSFASQVSLLQASPVVLPTHCHCCPPTAIAITS